MALAPGSVNPRSIQTLDELTAPATKGPTGGVVSLTVPPADRLKVANEYKIAMLALDAHKFWQKGAAGSYRSKGLWTPQRRAVGLAHAYLAARKHSAADAPREAALIKMPTGTGKTGVIATLACLSPLVKKVLILTPRNGLVHQMRHDLSFRFWGRSVSGVYYDGKLHENLKQKDIDDLTTSIKNGVRSPVRVLAAAEYDKIWKERHEDRQILVSTFNALHLVLGIEAPAHRSMYGKGPRPVATSLNGLDPTKSADECLKAFQDLLKSVDLVIVDEGHHEPAYSCSQAVRAIDKPTIIFSATPYRNDYKYFEIDGSFVFNLPWQEAVDQKLIREVQFAAPVAAASAGSPGRPGHRPAKPYSPKRFVDEFSETLNALPAGKRVIVHAGTFATLKALQLAFFKKDKNEAAVLIHDAYEGAAELECRDLDVLKTLQKGQLKELRFSQVHKAEENDAAQNARVWLHQFKLMEGIDDSRFIEVWLYDGLGNARQVVQQIGRAIRRPDLNDPTGQIATIRGSSKLLDRYDGASTVSVQTQRRWNEYLEYEKYAAERTDVAFIAETQLVASVKRTAPAVQYIAGEFKAGHLLDQNPTMSAFVLPRRAVVCRVEGVDKHDPTAISDKFLDDLQDACREAMQLEERFDIALVPAPLDKAYKHVRLIRYLAWGNSPYLASHHIPEWRLGVMAIVRSGRYIVVLDTESICIDYGRLRLLSPEPVELKRLFSRNAPGVTPPANATRIVETVASGLDTSELGLRSLSVRKRALDDGYFDLAESSQVPTSVRGFGQLGNKSARRRLSLSRSSVADATNKPLTVKEYVVWAQTVGHTMANTAVEPHAFFDRFAREVTPLDEKKGVPLSILLDVWELLDVSTETQDERAWDPEKVKQILTLDTCCEISNRNSDPSKPPRYAFDFGTFEVEIGYIYKPAIPPSGRYSISCSALNQAVADPDASAGDGEVEADNTAFGRQMAVSLTRLINQEQSFRVVTSEPGVVYSKSHFYKPTIDEALMSILEPCKAVDGVVSEKGDTRVTNVANWDSKTLFGLVYGWITGSPTGKVKLAEELKSCATIICDDRGRETADFYGIDPVARRVLMVHAKALKETATVSARRLQDVTRQALASLAFAGSSRRPFPYSDSWESAWSVELEHAAKAIVTKPRIVRKAVKVAKPAKGIAAIPTPTLLAPVQSRSAVPVEH